MQVPTNVALSRLVAQQRALDVTAVNLANAGTPGFKAGRMVFSDWLSRPNAIDPPPGGRTVAYAQDRASYRDLQPGTVQQTGNPFDLAITGEGYFTVETPRGPRLTRAGHFTPTINGTLGDAEGNALLDTNGRPLRVSPNDLRVTVAGDGTVRSENGPLGRVGVVRPEDPHRMTAEGGRLLRADGPTVPVSRPALVQGALEDSNVQPITEMTRMMADLREFQFTSQFVQSEADRQQASIDKITSRRT